MTISKNDPRLTHYALDELETAELAEIEAAVQASPELQAEVASIRETIAQISETFAEEPLPEKEPADAPTPASLEKATTKKFNGLRTLALIASTVLIIALGVFAFNPDMRNMFVADNANAPGSDEDPKNWTFSNSSAPLADYSDAGNDNRASAAQRKAARAEDAPKRYGKDDDTYATKPEGKPPVTGSTTPMPPVPGIQRPGKGGLDISSGTPEPAESPAPEPDPVAMGVPMDPVVSDGDKESEKAQAGLIKSSGNLDEVVAVMGQTHTALETLGGNITELNRRIATEAASRDHIAKNVVPRGDTIDALQGSMQRTREAITAAEKDGRDSTALEEEYSRMVDKKKALYAYNKKLTESNAWRYQHSEHGPSAESYAQIIENQYRSVIDFEALSTFAVDVDTASYSLLRNTLTKQNRMPHPDSVRMEEMINYFNYDYATPTDEHPFAAHVDGAVCPWNKEHRLVRIGLKGKEMAKHERPATNLVFLLDCSGSMSSANKLTLVKKGMAMLVDQLDERDRVAIAVYAGASGLVLDSTACTDENKKEILSSLGRLHSGGSTNGGAGINLAYNVAEENLIKGGVNRVILCSDGDFNVGVTNTDALVKLVKTYADKNIFFTVLGFGRGNLKDNRMETLANKGNGNYGYVDSQDEAQLLLVDRLMGTLVTIAKDVKVQVEFNPRFVRAYRLLGYENRKLKAQDFNNDKKDAGEIGAGHTVTALYEIVPADNDEQLDLAKMEPQPEASTVDPLRYQLVKQPGEEATDDDKLEPSDELLTIKLRYKTPEGTNSTLMQHPVDNNFAPFDKTSADFKQAAAAAGLGMLLRHSKYSGSLTYDHLLYWADEVYEQKGDKLNQEFRILIQRAKELDTASVTPDSTIED